MLNLSDIPFQGMFTLVDRKHIPVSQTGASVPGTMWAKLAGWNCESNTELCAIDYV
jgi:hypothetical protein